MADPRFHPSAASTLRAAILEVGGDEVFAIGDVEDRRVVRLEVTCRGTADQVPALLARPRAGQVVIHNHPSGNLSPSDADLQLAGKYGEDGVGVVIVNNAVDQSRWVVEPHVPKRVLVNPEDVVRFFTYRLPRVLPGYEAREGQVAMALAVTEALNTDTIAVLEAGTGTGKSLAYLVPAAMWALANDGKVVIATHTLTLQGQLATADLPVLQQAGLEIRHVTVRGRNNYICRRRLDEAAMELGLPPASPVAEGRPPSTDDSEAQGDDDYDDADIETDNQHRVQALRELLRVVAQGHEGHRQALAFPVDPDIWDDVRSDPEQTLRARCPHFDTCFYYNARREAANAHLLVANHHLVLADLSIKADTGGDGVLPKYDRLILDEGHHLEDSATSLMSERTTATSIRRAIQRLLGNRRRKGALARLHKRFASPQSPLMDHERVRFAKTTSTLLATLPRLANVVSQNLDILLHACLSGADTTLRITPEIQKSDLWNATIEPSLQDISKGLGEAARHLDRLQDVLDGLAPAERLAEPQPVFELKRAHRILSGHARLVGEFVTTSAKDDATAEVVRWLERQNNRRSGASATLVTAPLEVGPLLRARMFDPLKTTVVTSATLTVRSRFDHFLGRVGLAHTLQAPEESQENDELDTILGDLGEGDGGGGLHTDIFPSPFSYSRQAVLGLPRDLPPPDSAEWADVICRATTASLFVARGGAFVLCTSFAMVDQLHAHAEAQLGNRMLLLRQGEMSRERLLERFRDSGDAVLFGTDSFWEGVSVKGNALRLVVIPKLPFRVPTEPIQLARSELLQSRGLDPFRASMLPEAVLRLRQGFGRLIRTQTDQGAVVILDRRIHDRWYGRVFLSSLPPARRITGPTRAVLQQVRTFLRGPQGS